MRFLNRILVVLIGVMTFGQLSAQEVYLDQALILSGGEFESSGPYNDFASVSFYDPVSQTYEFKDSIYSQSVQDAVIQDSFAYFAAQDSIVKYNIRSYQRAQNQTVDGIKWLSLIETGELMTGRYFGSLVQSYTTGNLAKNYGITDSLIGNVGDAAYHNDTVFISHNYTVNFTDSLGYLAIYNKNTNQVERNIRLDTLGAGISSLFKYDGKIYGHCKKNSQLMAYNLQSGSINFDSFSLQDPVGVFNGKIYGHNIMGRIQAYDLNTMQHQDLGIQVNFVSGSAPVAFNYDTFNDQFYVAHTNYSDTGFLQIYNMNGSMKTSFETNVSPNSIAFDYDMNQRPMANVDYDTFATGEEKNIQVLTNDKDPNDHSLMLTSIIDSTSIGTDSIAGNEIYYKAANQVYNDSITYEVCDGLGSCDTGKAYINVQSTTSRNLVTKKQGIEIYPNPVNKVLNLISSHELKGQTTVKIYNSKGKTLIERTHNSIKKQEKLEWNVGDLESGVYFIQIQNKERNITKKFIKK